MAREDYYGLNYSEKTTGVPHVRIWPQTGRAKEKKRAFTEELEKMVGDEVAHVMLCLAGDYKAPQGSAEIGEEEAVGSFDGEQEIVRTGNW